MPEISRFYRIISVLLICFSIISLAKAQDQAITDKIVAGIQSGSKYMTEVLLEKNGKSKCEYSITEGVWMDYEPAWHTGQLINSLLRAHDINGNKGYLKNAKKAGEWWCSLQITDHPVLNGMVKAIHGSGIDYIVFATVSDGTAGLFNLYKKTGIRKYGEIPSMAGEWMYKNLYLPGKGLCYDMVDPVTGEVQKSKSAFWPDKETRVCKITEKSRVYHLLSHFSV